MNHEWTKSPENHLKCLHCARGFIDHQPYATCDYCGAVGSCNIFGNIKNLRAPLLCASCERIEREKNTHIIDRTKVLADAAKIDDSIQYNGDVFNSKAIALIELKKAIDADDSLDAEQKKYKFQEVVAARYEKLKRVVFQLEKKRDELQLEQLVIAKNLRSMGDDIRKDIRQKIAQADANYVPPSQKPRATKIKTEVKPIEKKSALDILIDKMILFSDNPNMTREQALEEIRKFRKD